jgi:hypothetical protein
MLSKTHSRLASLAAVAAGLLAAGMPAARAELIYNYHEAWMFDSTSGLYWQVLQVPTSTFVAPAGPGTFATFQQVFDLTAETGFPYGQTGTTPAPYSQDFAKLLAFFQKDVPAILIPKPRNGSTTRFSVYDLYNYPPDAPNFEYAILQYAGGPGLETGYWAATVTTTLGTYGPGDACPYPYANNPPGCPATEPALIVSNVRPTPLPGADWLMVSGLSAFALVSVMRSRRRS